jgi:hypothetical protein
MEEKYLKLAKEQFSTLKEESLDDDRYSLGAIGEKDYEESGVKFKIKVDGFWESSTWFDYYVYDSLEIEIEKGEYFYY